MVARTAASRRYTVLRPSGVPSSRSRRAISPGGRSGSSRSNAPTRARIAASTRGRPTVDLGDASLTGASHPIRSMVRRDTPNCSATARGARPARNSSCTACRSSILSILLCLR